jgi:hypothetical protein
LRIAPQTKHRGLDLSHHRRASLGAFERGKQFLEARHLGRDRSRDLVVLSLAGRSQYGGRTGGDPLCLA